MKNLGKIDKENFINFLSKATPEEINQLVTEKGKPRRLIEPIFFENKYDKYKKNK